MTADTIALLFVLLVLGVALGNLLGEFLFRLMNPDDGGDE
jgi:hypothetical protein